jgi:hypothetical protein
MPIYHAPALRACSEAARRFACGRCKRPLDLGLEPLLIEPGNAIQGHARELGELRAGALGHELVEAARGELDAVDVVRGMAAISLRRMNVFGSSDR